MKTFWVDYFAWANAQLAAFLSAKVSLVAAALAPAITSLALLYVIFMGYRFLTEPMGHEIIMQTVMRFVVLAVVLGMSINLALFNPLVVNTFVSGPSQLTAAIVGASSPGATLDAVFSDASTIAETYLAKAGVFSGDPAFYLAAAAVYLLVGACIVYTAALLVLSALALHVLLALFPLFLQLILFNPTKTFTANYFSVMVNFALIGVLAVLFCAIALGTLQKFAAANVALGNGIQLGHAAMMCSFAVMLLLCLKQAPAMAAGLASGLALSTFGAFSHGVSRALRLPGSVASTGGQFIRGYRDTSRGRHDSLTRLAGQSLSGRYKRPRQALPSPRVGP